MACKYCADYIARGLKDVENFEMTDASVNLKLLIEQMREQIQNLQ